MPFKIQKIAYCVFVHNRFLYPCVIHILTCYTYYESIKYKHKVSENENNQESKISTLVSVILSSITGQLCLLEQTWSIKVKQARFSIITFVIKAQRGIKQRKLLRLECRKSYCCSIKSSLSKTKLFPSISITNKTSHPLYHLTFSLIL